MEVKEKKGELLRDVMEIAGDERSLERKNVEI